MAVGNRKRGFGGKGKAALRAARGGDSPRVSLYEEVTATITGDNYTTLVMTANL